MTNLSPADFAVRVVTEFCIPVINGAAQGQSPVPGSELDPDQRTRLELNAKGRTFVYLVGQTPIGLDLSGNRSQLWFNHADAHGVHAIVEKAVLAKWPQFGLVVDEPSRTPTLHRRVLQGNLADGKFAQVEFVYPADPISGSKLFMTRVYALLAPGDAPPQSSPPIEVPPIAAPSAKASKKKGWF